MQENSLLELVHKIQQFGCDFQTVEVKPAEKSYPSRLLTTLSSFSNQDEGGIILFGLSKGHGWKVVGVYDAHDLQQRVTAQCNEMSPAVRPLFTVIEIEGKYVVSAEIPSVDVAKRPVYYKGQGRSNGSFIRVGDADEPATEEEIYSYEAYRSRIKDDIRQIPEAKVSMLRPEAVQRYLGSIKKERPNIAAYAADDEILELMGIIGDGTPTLAGMVVFGKYPQGLFPQLTITAVVIAGTAMGDEDEKGVRFIANKRIDGTIEEMLDGAMSFALRNMRVKTIIDDRGTRKDQEEFPLKAVREVILNALVHRDYSIHTEGTPITIRMFSDRMEVVNKGGLFGRGSIKALGVVDPDTRNPHLATILEALRIAENRYSGIPTIRSEMNKAGLPAPVFFSQRGEFTVILYNTPIVEKASFSLTEREQQLIEFCKTPRTRTEIVEYLGLSPSYAISTVLNPLIEQGLITLSIPDRPSSSKQRFWAK